MNRLQQPTIAALLPTAFAVRNVVHSGVLRTLNECGISVHLLLRNCPPDLLERDSLFSYAASCLPLVIPNEKQVRGRAFLNGVIRKAFSRRYGIKSYDLYRRWFERNSTTKERFRSAVIEAVGTMAQPKPIIRVCERLSEVLYGRGHDLNPIRKTLLTLRPDLVWSTMCTSAFEYPYILVARELKIPTIASILSFDNLTSRSLLPVYDHYLVWSDRMRAQLLRLYPSLTPDQVTITGSPQFDFHRTERFTWTREKTCNSLKVPQDTRYFLYAASHESLAPAEPLLVSELARKMEEDPILSGYQLVVRMHPHDDGTRWSRVTARSKLVTLSQVYSSGCKDGEAALPTQHDNGLLISSLAHAEACLNIVSTIALDAAILDRPVIGIEFRGEQDSPREIMFEEYGTDHYLPLVRSGGLRVAKSWSDLIVLMRLAIEQPEQDRERRIVMVREECGLTDGLSAERVAEKLMEWVHGGLKESWRPSVMSPGRTERAAQPDSA